MFLVDRALGAGPRPCESVKWLVTLAVSAQGPHWDASFVQVSDTPEG
jgi:hypothetical protein